MLYLRPALDGSTAPSSAASPPPNPTSVTTSGLRRGDKTQRGRCCHVDPEDGGSTERTTKTMNAGKFDFTGVVEVGISATWRLTTARLHLESCQSTRSMPPLEGTASSAMTPRAQNLVTFSPAPIATRSLIFPRCCWSLQRRRRYTACCPKFSSAVRPMP